MGDAMINPTKQTFDEFLNLAWNDHANKTAEVADRLLGAHALIELPEQIPRLAQLVTHVYGEHLGEWEKGIEILLKIKTIPLVANGSGSESIGLAAITRSIAVLEIACGRKTNVDDLTLSDQVRVLATAASALSEQKDSDRAHRYFRDALGKAQLGLQKEDPANRALAVTGNNLACALEEKNSRSVSESDFMILSAQTARKYWEIAGTWMEVERAEYRLSQTYLKAGDFVKSLEHAQDCLEIAIANDAPPIELFFGYEALALAERAKGNVLGFQKAMEHIRLNFDKLSAEDKTWCEATLKRLAQ
jgi:tetratricopeptide (TPR) repeat protein